MQKFYVYEHLRADTGAVFYVGKGQGRRAHVSSPHHRNQHWMRVFAKAGGFVVNIVAEKLDEELAFLVECERIDQARRTGIALCNQTDGGEGVSGWVKSLEWREKIGSAHRGKILTAETKEKISKAVLAAGYRHSEETRRRMSMAQIGHTRNRGRVQSLEERYRRAASLIGNRSRMGQTRSAEERARASASLRGRKQSALECPHCGVIGGNAMRRWHFNNCRRVT
jgi:hypothetical protein